MTGDRAGARPLPAGPASSVVKRVFDVGVSAIGLLVASPLLLLIAILVKLTSPGPVLYIAPRAGLRGARFGMLKFRTMRPGSDDVKRRVTEQNDDRITAIGKILRKSKFDELPQLWNVLRGDMSIVGPRPDDIDIVKDHYSAEHLRALETRPGICGPAEVRWYPDLTYHDPPPPGVPVQQHYIDRHMPAQTAEAVRYIQRQNLLIDLKIIALTAFNVLVRSWLPPAKKPLADEDFTAADGTEKSGNAQGVS